VNVICTLQVILAALVTVGFGTTIAMPLLFFGLVSIHHRNTFVLYGGDMILRLLLMILWFAPAGSPLSVDHWLIDGDLGLRETGPAWPLRLV